MRKRNGRNFRVGLLATADANGVITLTGDVALSSTVSFAEGKTYTIKGNGHKLTHGDSYRGALLTVPKNTTLTIENLVIDGGKIVFVQPSGADVPKTGDSTPLALLFTLLALSGLTFLTLRKKSLTH